MLLTILEQLGLHVWFRYEKYREEFSADDVVIAVDETPVGVFVEIEGGEDAIHDTARALGCTPADYITDSYRFLFLQHRDANGLDGPDMVFAGLPTERPARRWAAPAMPSARRRGNLRLAGAGADRRTGHPAAAALVRARQGRAAGGRRRRWSSASCAGCAPPASRASC